MILSQFFMIFDIGWVDVFWGLFWFFTIIGLYTSLIIGYSRISAVSHFTKNIMPDLYDGKLKIVKEENRLLKIDNKQLRHDNQNYSDNQIAFKKLIGG